MPNGVTGWRNHTSPEAIQALPSLEELGVPPELLEAAGELFSDVDGPGVEEYRLSTLLRLIVFHLRNVPHSYDPHRFSACQKD